MTVENLLNRTKYTCGFRKCDKNNYYDAIVHNYQCLIEKAIEVLGATRKVKGARIRVASKMAIPFCILDALEKNENEISSQIEKNSNSWLYIWYVTCCKMRYR